MEARIVIINGSGGSGKSTFVRLCKEILESQTNWNVLELSTVDWVKAVAQFAGWDGSKEEKDRKFLHELKMALEEWIILPIKKYLTKLMCSQ